MNYTLCILLFLFAGYGASGQAGFALAPVDYQKLVSRADLHYNRPVERSEEGMPVGNGRMGSLVWTDPQTFRLQVNRVDIFGNDASSDNFFERHTDYCGGAGFVDINFLHAGKPVFSGEDFSQHLSCNNGLVTIKSQGIKIETLAWNECDVMAVQLSGDNLDEYQLTAHLRMLRPRLVTTGDHTAESKLETRDGRLILSQKFTEDDYYCSSAVVIMILGCGSDIAPANKADLMAVLAKANKPVTLLIASAASFEPSVDVIAIATEQLESARNKGFEGMLRSNREWWKNFWTKSFVQLHSDDGVADMLEENYTYFQYVMASSSLGKLPPKFNGMLWSTDGDSRKWGNLYWGANQSCLYNGLFPANRPELMEPLFNMYTGMYRSCERAAVEQWGSAGIFIPETVSFAGLPGLPEDIAAEMRQLYLLQKPWNGRSQQFVEYARTKMPFLSRWNWKKDIGWKDGQWQFSDKGGETFGHVTHIFSRGAKIAYQYWMHYEYTLDREWLQNRAYPMIKGVAEFYRNFPNLKKESDGKYHIRHVNDNESTWNGHNTIEEMSSMYGILPVAIRASEILDIDPGLRERWKELLTNLSPMPTFVHEGKAIWARSLEPVGQGPTNRPPDPNTMPVWFFDLCNMDASPEIVAVADNTFNRFFPEGINGRSRVNVLSKLPVAGSLLGRKESTRWLVPNQVNTEESPVLKNRMDLREGYQTTSVQRLGRVTDALNLALLQSAPSTPGQEPVIRVFPAWPDEWEGSFNLLARGGFMVTSSFKNGKVEFVKIESRAGQDCIIHNPWPGQPVDLLRNGNKEPLGDKPLFRIKTTKGDSFMLTQNPKSTAQNTGELSSGLAKTIMLRYPDPNNYPYRSWCYPQGYMLMGMAKLFSTTNDSVYFRYIMKYADGHVDSLGNLPRFKGNSMDDMMAGAIIVWAYKQTGLEKYKKAAGQIKQKFSDYPRTSDGLFWHGRKTTGEVWVDGVFMGQMFLTAYGKYIGDTEACFDEAALQLTGIYNKLKKEENGLLYHAWDEDRDAAWADRSTGLSPEVWSEGLGWYALILVETLEIFPGDHPQRPGLERICSDLMEALRKAQDKKSGLWYQVVDKGDKSDNWHDASGSAMFLYAIQKASELNLIKGKQYMEAVKRAYEGLLTKTIASQADGLIDIVDACDGLCVQPSYDVYINYKKKVNAKEAVAGVLWASWIVEKPK